MEKITVQIYTENFWWVTDDKRGHWSMLYRDKERRKPKIFKSTEDALKFVTTMNPYCNRKNQRRIMKGNQVIIEL